jgi:hypothetical protein
MPGLTQKLVKLSYTMTTTGLKLAQLLLDRQVHKVYKETQDQPDHKVYKDQQVLQVQEQPEVLT